MPAETLPSDAQPLDPAMAPPMAGDVSVSMPTAGAPMSALAPQAMDLMAH